MSMSLGHVMSWAWRCFVECSSFVNHFKLVKIMHLNGSNLCLQINETHAFYSMKFILKTEI